MMAGNSEKGVTLAEVLAARNLIRHHAWRTPLVASAALSEAAGCQACLKMECWQHTGSFKLRGALSKLSALTPEERERGVVTASAGNHGLGVAYAGQVLGLEAITIFVPTSAPRAKVERLEAFGCEICRDGADYDATHALAEAYAEAQGALYISAYDDPVVIAAQGTVGLEVMEEMPEADLLLVPVGGGGLIAGTAIAAKTINPAVRIVGLQPEASPSAYLSLRDGRPYETYAAGPTICDGLAGGFGRMPFEIAGHLIDEVLVVPEAEVRRAVGWLVSHEQVIVEGSGAIAVAPLLSGQLDAGGRQVVSVLTGRNIDATLLQEILAQAEV
jgi:threonine dehydratase